MGTPEIYDVVIVGGGQAALALGYYLQRAGVRFLILDESPEVGYSWRMRPDSLKLTTSNLFNSLPGLPFPGKKDAYASKDEVADYLQAYAGKFALPITLNTRVTELIKDSEGKFSLHTKTGEKFRARAVVIAGGFSRKSRIPTIADDIPSNIHQTYSKGYKNAEQVPTGKVLVVGSGLSAAQIAEELLANGREVYLSHQGTFKYLPLSPRLERLSFFVRDYILRSTLLADVVDKIDRHLIIGTDVRAILAHPRLHELDQITDASEVVALGVKSIVWATGFSPDLDWIKLDILNENGQPRHKRGVSPVQGLYFLGYSILEWNKGAGLHAIGGEAKYLAKKIVG